jgi:hypothetical protein
MCVHLPYHSVGHSADMQCIRYTTLDLDHGLIKPLRHWQKGNHYPVLRLTVLRKFTFRLFTPQLKV